MPAIYDRAARCVERLAQLDPLSATMRGIQGYDAQMTELSPAGVEARAELVRSTLATRGTLAPVTDRERTAAGVLGERLQVSADRHRAGDDYRDLNNINSAVQVVRQVFDVMPTETAEQWEAICSRLERVPDAIEGLCATLREGLQREVSAARRQALTCSEQARVWSGGRPGTPPFFMTLVERAQRTNAPDGTFRRRLEDSARAAGAAYADLSRFLREEYAPRASERDPVGPARRRCTTPVPPRTSAGLGAPGTRRWGGPASRSGARSRPPTTRECRGITCRWGRSASWPPS